MVAIEYRVSTTSSITPSLENSADNGLDMDRFYLEGLLVDANRRPSNDYTGADALIDDVINHVGLVAGTDRYTREVARTISRVPREIGVSLEDHIRQVVRQANYVASHHHVFSAGMRLYLARAEAMTTQEYAPSATLQHLVFITDTVVRLRERGYSLSDALGQIKIRYVRHPLFSPVIEMYGKEVREREASVH